MVEEELITLNIGGLLYKISSKYLNKYPNTRLGKLKNKEKLDKICDKFDLDKNEYFFDHSSIFFNQILNYYRYDKIHLNDDLCPHDIENELDYWGLDYYSIDHCCRSRLIKKKDLIDIDLKKEHDLIVNLSIKRLNKTDLTIKEKLWILFNKPKSSVEAKIVHVLSIFFILLSTFCLVLSTEFDQNNLNNFNNSFLLKRTENGSLLILKIFDFIETICVIWFSVEFLIRFFTCKSKKKFFRGFMNIIDLVVCVPFYLGFILDRYVLYNKMKRLLQMLRILRVLKLGRHSTSIKSLGQTFKTSSKELLILLIHVGINILLFSSIVYYAEKDDQDTKFTSIISSFWWALITMTTVGYGDMYPNTTIGKMLGSVCALCGILTIALPLAIISKNFEDFHNRNEEKKNLIKKIEKYEFSSKKALNESINEKFNNIKPEEVSLNLKESN